jgi:uncharacterized phiE125 gp8 family phage protein
MLQFFNQSIHTSLTQITPPAAEPITLAVAKNQCRIDSDITQDDALITALIVAARQLVETKLNRAIVTQTWQYNLDIFPFFGSWALPSTPIVLPLPPVQSVSSVKYVASDGTLTTLATNQYQVDLASQPARICPINGQPWPVVNIYTINSVQIEFVCGYGLPTDSPQSIPQSIIQAMLLLVSHWYDQRSATSDVSLSEYPLAVDALLGTQQTGVYF